jgi:agmatinase
MTDLDTAVSDLTAGDVAVLGVPSDVHSSFRRGAAKAPPRVREALYGTGTSMCTEGVLDLASEPRWRDVGDLDLSGEDTDFEVIERSVARIAERGARVVSLGGDHFVTYPILRGHSAVYPDLNVLHLDAHPDLYDELHGDRLSHACPFARSMEDGLIQRLVQVGIRVMTPHQQEQAESLGVEVFDMRAWQPGLRFEFEGPVYLSIDLDVLDPAFVPGVSHPEPGGLSSREVIQLVQELEGNLVGADIVEYNPDRDWMGITAMVAAKLLKEVSARLLEGD